MKIHQPTRWEMEALAEKAEKHPELITTDEKFDLFFFWDSPGLRLIEDLYYDNWDAAMDWFEIMYVEEDDDE